MSWRTLYVLTLLMVAIAGIGIAAIPAALAILSHRPGTEARP